MHRFQNRSTLVRLRLAALLLGLKYLLIPLSIGLLTYSFYSDNQDLLFIAVGVCAMTVLMMITQWILAARPRCPLCLTPILASKNCSKHRRAESLFGSYRLRVALAILFRGRFLCLYCNEPTAMEVRSKQTASGGRRRR